MLADDRRGQIPHTDYVRLNEVQLQKNDTGIVLDLSVQNYCLILKEHN